VDIQKKLVRDSGLLNIFNIPFSGEIFEKSQEKKFCNGQTIYSVGEAADSVYIIEKGKVKLFTINSAGDEQVQVIRKEKEFFGEEAATSLGLTARHSSACATEDCTCLMIPKEVLKAESQFNETILKVTRERGVESVFHQLEENFQYLQESNIDVAKIDERVEKFKDREVIFYQNDKSDAAYIILSGEVDIRTENERGEIILNVTLEPGEIFGELGIIKKLPRIAMAVSRGNSELIVLDKETLLKMYGSSDRFKEVLVSLENVYKTPHVGRVKRYQGVFLGLPAICLKMDVSKEMKLIGYQVTGNGIFCISRLGIEDYETFVYQRNEQEKREIRVKDGELVGVVNFGYWDDNSDLVQMIIEKTKMTPEILERFIVSGSLATKSFKLISVGEDILCKCMLISTQTIVDTIKSGANSLKQVMKCTGAGSVCGGCRPRIQELLGYDVWKSCNIFKIIKHNNIIWSFQLKPINAEDKKTFLPGQHVVIRFQINGNWVERPYTLTSHPEDDFYEITIKREEKGALSNWLFENASENMIAYVSKPQGEFLIKYPFQTPVIFYAGGIGITPAIMMAKMIRNEPSISVTIDYSFRNAGEDIFRIEFEKMSEKYPNFKVRYRQTVKEGRLTSDEISRQIELMANADIYICGPDSYTRNIKNTLIENLKIPQEKIYVEEFSNVGGPEQVKE